MSSPNPNLPLPQFLSSTLQPLLPIFNDSIPSSTTSAQSTLSTAADNLYLIGRMMSSLGLYSENEDVDELGERELVFMAAAWVLGEVEGRRGVTRLEGGGGRQEDGGEGGVSMDGRMGAVKRSDTAYQSFVHLLMSYKILSPEEISEAQSLAQNVGAPTPAARVTPRDPARRREEKIRAYKREKELRGTIAAAIPGDAEPSSHPLAFILPLLPSPTPTSQSRSSTSVNDENEVPVLRSIILLLLRLLYTLTLSSLSSNQMELELLSHAPVDPDAERRRAAAAAGQDRSDSTDSDNTWRLDRAPAQRDARMGGLISGGGKVLRPFTILPSTSAMSDRERLKSEVFRSGHRLPSMTVDEYLEEEMRRGGIISGGGQASADAPTTSELLQLASENDGTYDAEEAEEQKRQKDENWARFTDENRKGAGNTMNRG